MVSIVRRPGMTDAQYRAAVKNASDFMKRHRQRQRSRNKKSPNMVYDVSNQPYLRKISSPTTNFVKPKRPSKDNLTKEQLYALRVAQYHSQRDAARKSLLPTIKLIPQKVDPIRGIKVNPRRSFRDTLLEAQRNAAKRASNQFNKKSAEQVKQFYDSLPKQPIKKAKSPRTTQKQNVITAVALGPKPGTSDIIYSNPNSDLSLQEQRAKYRKSLKSKYRGGSGKKKYNQAAYLAGFGMNPNIRKNQGIYKPYANGGGVRKPKYKE